MDQLLSPNRTWIGVSDVTMRSYNRTGTRTGGGGQLLSPERTWRGGSNVTMLLCNRTGTRTGGSAMTSSATEKLSRKRLSR